MSIEMDDLVGLNATSVQRIVSLSPQDAVTALRTLWRKSGTITPAGMRHSQGGHTAYEGGTVLLTETMGLKLTETKRLGWERFFAPDWDKGQITVAAGVTWTELHAHLRGTGWAPMVQQSSAHFTIGGSVAVNCHGRDPRWGPMVDSVESLKVLCGDRKVRDASRGENTDLFAAVVGGYGACGLILQVRLRLVPNHMLGPNSPSKEVSLDDYIGRTLRPLIDRAAGTGTTELHFGWLRCTEKDFWGKVWVKNCVSLSGKDIDKTGQLDSLEWGESEILRASWAAARRDPDIKAALWQEMMRQDSTVQKSRTNFLRASVDMTLSKGDSQGVDILQEYFFPPDKLQEGLELLKTHFQISEHSKVVNVLSSTLRVVRQDNVTNLSYCRDGDRVSLAVEAHVPVELDNQGCRRPTPAAQEVLWQANEIVLGLGGCHYLPYYRLEPPAGKAKDAQFKSAYGSVPAAPNLDAQKHAMQKYDPQRRFWNSFLQTYLA